MSFTYPVSENVGRGGGVVCGGGRQPFGVLIDSGLRDSIEGEAECLATGDYLFLDPDKQSRKKKKNGGNFRTPP
jgi:hypothetical protein